MPSVTLKESMGYVSCCDKQQPQLSFQRRGSGCVRDDLSWSQKPKRSRQITQNLQRGRTASFEGIRSLDQEEAQNSPHQNENPMWIIFWESQKFESEDQVWTCNLPSNWGEPCKSLPMWWDRKFLPAHAGGGFQQILLAVINWTPPWPSPFKMRRSVEVETNYPCSRVFDKCSQPHSKLNWRDVVLRSAVSVHGYNQSLPERLRITIVNLDWGTRRPTYCEWITIMLTMGKVNCL